MPGTPPAATAPPAPAAASRRRPPPLVVGILILLGTGAVQGLWSGRWSDRGGVREAVARLGRVPPEVGPWRGHDLDFRAEDYRGAGIAGGLRRAYRDGETGESVTVVIVCGDPGQISVHTPEVCYPAAGYTVLGRPTREVPGGGPSEDLGSFRRLRVGREGPPGADELEILYAWSRDGRWRAPEWDARLSYARAPYLYKMYVIESRRGGGGRGPRDRGAAGPARAFLRDFLPALRGTLFEAAPPPARS